MSSLNRKTSLRDPHPAGCSNTRNPARVERHRAGAGKCDSEGRVSEQKGQFDALSCGEEAALMLTAIATSITERTATAPTGVRSLSTNRLPPANSLAPAAAANATPGLLFGPRRKLFFVS
jgi:hypothetical protein